MRKSRTCCLFFKASLTWWWWWWSTSPPSKPYRMLSNTGESNNNRLGLRSRLQCVHAGRTHFFTRTRTHTTFRQNARTNSEKCLSPNPAFLVGGLVRTRNQRGCDARGWGSKLSLWLSLSDFSRRSLLDATKLGKRMGLIDTKLLAVVIEELVVTFGFWRRGRTGRVGGEAIFKCIFEPRIIISIVVLLVHRTELPTVNSPNEKQFS